MQRQAVAVMCFSGGNGGMEISAARLADILSKVSDVTLFCKKDSFLEDLYSKNKEYAFGCEAIKFSSRTFSFSMLRQIRSILKSNKFGNVVFFGASELKTLYFSFLGHELNLIVWHGTTKSRPKHDFLHKLVYSRVNYHVAISSHLFSNVRKIVPRSKGVDYRLIRPSFEIDTSARNTDKNEKKGCLSITHLGRLAEGKGQIDAVLACRKLYENGIEFRLSVVGHDDNSPYVKELMKTIDDVPYSNSISVEGFVEDVNEFLSDTDIFLFPSIGEGMPGAFIEALHHKVVCIAYDNTVFPEFLDMGFYVHIVKHKDIDRLTGVLYEVALDIENEKNRAEANIKLSEEAFRTDREVADWLEILV